MAACRNNFKKKLLRYLEKRSLTVNFLKFCSDSFYRDTDRHVVFKFRDIWPTGKIGEIVHCLCLPGKKFAWLSSCRYCADRAQNLQGPEGTMYSECFRFYPNRFTFGGVVGLGERVNRAKTRRKARSTPATCRSNIVVATSNFVACCFDIVAGVERS